VVVRRALAVLALSACWMLLTITASSAYASCGDWLQHGDKPTVHPATSVPAVVARDDVAQRLPVAPCNGPYCARVPEQPVTPAPAEISFAPAKSALQIGLVTFAEHTSESQIAGEADAKRAMGFPALIYHPPRA
jgi:hypothetical protein